MLLKLSSVIPSIDQGSLIWGAFELRWAWLLLLLPLPWLLRLLIPAKATRSEQAPRLPFAYALEEMPASRQQGQLWQPLCYFLIWACLLFATARPYWLGEPQPLPQEGRDLLLAVDLSGSMRTPDMGSRTQPRRRVDAVIQLGSDFIRRRQGDRVGLILFGSAAYLQSPLSFDRNTVRSLLSEAELGLAGNDTAIGDAIGLAVKRLQRVGTEQRVLILLTDGENTAGTIEPLQAAELAATAGLKIYTIGIGADRMETRSVFGNRSITPSQGLDETTLRAVASLTGGQYFRAKNRNDLANIYRELDLLEPTETDAETIRPRKSLLHWPLLLALLLSAVWLRRSAEEL